MWSIEVRPGGTKSSFVGFCNQNYIEYIKVQIGIERIMWHFDNFEKPKVKGLILEFCHFPIRVIWTLVSQNSQNKLQHTAHVFFETSYWKRILLFYFWSWILTFLKFLMFVFIQMWIQLIWTRRVLFKPRLHFKGKKKRLLYRRRMSMWREKDDYFKNPRGPRYRGHNCHIGQ